ncbi:hypothetical protein D3C87_1143970 [compost metagenome]
MRGRRQGRRRDRQGRSADLRQAQAVHLVRQRAQRVAERYARHRQQQRAVLFRYLVAGAHEDAARAVDDVRLHARGDQAHHAVLKRLAVAARVLVPDHQIHRHALLPPVGMRLDQLANQLEVGRILDPKQHDGQVARDGVSPQTRLSAAILHQRRRLRAHGRVLVDDGVGKPCIELGVRLGGVQLAHDYLRVRPRQFQGPVGQVAIPVFADQVHAGAAAVTHALHQIDDRGFLRLQGDLAANRGDRVQHRTLAVRQRRVALQRLGISCRAASA